MWNIEMKSWNIFSNMMIFGKKLYNSKLQHTVNGWLFLMYVKESWWYKEVIKE